MGILDKIHDAANRSIKYKLIDEITVQISELLYSKVQNQCWTNHETAAGSSKPDLESTC